MNTPIPITHRDLVKNVQGVSITDIVKCIDASSVGMKSILDDKNNIKGFDVRLTIGTEKLNAEELSLLKDSAPNSRYANGALTCSWRLSKRFFEENRDKLLPLMTGRLTKEVEEVFKSRKLMSVSGDLSLANLSTSLAPEKEGLWGRLIKSVTAQRQISEPGMSMG